MIRDMMAIIRNEKKKPRKFREEEGLMDMPIHDLGIKMVKTLSSPKKKLTEEEKKAEKEKEKKSEEKVVEKPKINYGSKKIYEVLEDINYARDRLFSKIVVPVDLSISKKKRGRRTTTNGSMQSKSIMNETLDLNSQSPIRMSP